MMKKKRKGPDAHNYGHPFLFSPSFVHKDLDLRKMRAKTYIILISGSQAHTQLLKERSCNLGYIPVFCELIILSMLIHWPPSESEKGKGVRERCARSGSTLGHPVRL